MRRAVKRMKFKRRKTALKKTIRREVKAMSETKVVQGTTSEFSLFSTNGVRDAYLIDLNFTD